MHRAFLSWSSSDARIGPLAELFKGWLNMVFDGQIDFFYSQEIAPGARAVDKIYDALNSADFGFMFLSQRTARSPWVLFEYGCLNPSRKEEKLFPLLLDMTPEQLAQIAPPFGGYQAVSVQSKDAVMLLVGHIAGLLNMSKKEEYAVRDRALKHYGDFKEGLDDLCSDAKLLPDRFTGVLPYNSNIKGSANFQIPHIFSEFEEELFLVGINLNFLLNLKTNAENFKALLNTLTANEKLKVKILIADLWDERILHTYDRIVFGYSNLEMEGLNLVFQDTGSEYYIDTFIRNHCTDAEYEQLKKQLTIKKIDLLMDTFWIVDADIPEKKGDMMIIPMTAMSGEDRPVFYANMRAQPDVFASYHNVCSVGYNASKDTLWPV